MNAQKQQSEVDILLVEDSPDDVELTREAFRSAQISNHLHVVEDGVEAMRFLRSDGQYAGTPRPELILLDLNLPRMSGHEVLAAVRADATLRLIPVIVLTTSDSHDDILKSYEMHANCYIRKPVGLKELCEVVKRIDQFWFDLVRLPEVTS